MRFVDNDLLNCFRQATRCEWCKRALRYRAHPHHLFSRGHGAGQRMDLRCNLIALGGPFDCACHDAYHNGRVDRASLLAVVCKREGLLLGEGELETVLLVLQDMPTRRIAGDLERRLAVLNARQGDLIRGIVWQK